MEFIQRLSTIQDAHVLKNFDMKRCTGYGVGGYAKYYAEVYSVQALKQIILVAQSFNVPYRFLGNGTNVLVSDSGYKGLIICLKKLDKIILQNYILTAGGGVSLCKLVNFATKHGLYGAEALSGIPASVGGAVVMNASAFGVNVSDFIQTVTTLKDGELINYSVDDCGFRYRGSRFLRATEPIVEVSFKFYTDEKYKQLSNLTDCAKQRKLHQPKGRSCGCVFKNPEGDYAGRLIDLANLKGKRIGGAWVSDKHANFIVAGESATATDVYNLINYVKRAVYQKFNVLLQEEVEYFGEF